MRKNEMLKGVLLVGLGASIYGMLATVVKIAYKDGYTTAEVTTSQFVIGILCLLVLNLVQTTTAKKSLAKPQKKDIFKLILAGTSLGFTSLFYYLSVQFINVSIAIILLMQSVWISIVIESLISRSFPTARKVISTVLVLLGTLLATNAIGSEVELDWKGVFWGMMAAISFSTTMFTSNRIANYLPTLRKSFLMLSGGLLVVLTFCFVTQIAPSLIGGVAEFYDEINFEFATTERFDFSIFLSYGIFLAVFGTILPPIFFNLGFPKVGLGLGGIVSSIELPVSVLFAYFLLNEQVLMIQWMGIVLILSAIVYMNLNSVKA